MTPTSSSHLVRHLTHIQNSNAALLISNVDVYFKFDEYSKIEFLDRLNVQCTLQFGSSTVGWYCIIRSSVALCRLNASGLLCWE